LDRQFRIVVAWVIHLVETLCTAFLRHDSTITLSKRCSRKYDVGFFHCCSFRVIQYDHIFACKCSIDLCSRKTTVKVVFNHNHSIVILCKCLLQALTTQDCHTHRVHFRNRQGQTCITQILCNLCSSFHNGRILQACT